MINMIEAGEALKMTEAAYEHVMKSTAADLFARIEVEAKKGCRVASALSDFVPGFNLKRRLFKLEYEKDLITYFKSYGYKIKRKVRGWTSCSIEFEVKW